MTVPTRRLLAVLAALILATCGGTSGGEPSQESAAAPPTASPETAAEGPAPEAPESPPADPAEAVAPALSGARLTALLEPRDWTWDDLLEWRVIRALVVPSKTLFFYDKGRQRGIAADALAELEKHLNATLDVGRRKFQVAAIPVARADVLRYLAEGRGEIAVGNLTVTPEREEVVDFTVPTSKPIDEVIVTGPGGPDLAGLDDLSGRRVYVRRSSSFWGSLEALSTSLAERGLAPIELQAADENLETEDILEMVNAGIVPITVADTHMAGFWDDVFPDLVVHTDLEVAEGRRTAWAVRKSATGLKEILDPWVAAHRQGTLLGNMLVKRYLQANPWVKNATAEEDRRRFLDLVAHFREYGRRYDLDPIMVAAQGYQESGLDQSVRSRVGAIGVMQVMPTTARDPAVGIPDIHQVEPNIHAGSKYLRHLIDVYFDEPAIDEQNRLLFAFAGYNAGPNRINRLRRTAAAEGLDANRWFRNVELVVAREVGREPVHYVSNIYKYYVAYTLFLATEGDPQP